MPFFNVYNVEGVQYQDQAPGCKIAKPPMAHVVRHRATGPQGHRAQSCYKALDAALVAAGLPDSTACRRTEIADNAPDEARAAARIATALSQRLSRATKAAIKAACDAGRKTVRSGNMTPERAETVLTTRLTGVQMTDADKKALHDACRAGAGLTASPAAVQPQMTPKAAENLLASCQRIADTMPPREALTEIMRMLENALAPTTNLPVTPTPAETKARTRTRRKLKAAFYAALSPSPWQQCQGLFCILLP